MMVPCLRTVILYLVLIIGMRILGKRQIGQLEPSEFVVAMLIADLASVPMQSPGIPLLAGLVPIATVLGLELTLSGLTMASVKLRRLLCGKPVILIENGRLLQDSLRRTRINLDELTSQLRTKDILDISTVQYAILETDGSVSVFPFPKDAPASAQDAGIKAKKQYLPYTIIDDGCPIWQNLEKSGRTRTWLEDQLRSRRTTMAQTFLMTVDDSGRVYWLGKEET